MTNPTDPAPRQPVDIWQIRRDLQAQQYPAYRVPLPPRTGLLLPHRHNSRCGRCARPWWAVRVHHSTEYTKTDDGWCTAGIFPLCHRCWTHLATPARRLPYYRRVFDTWLAQAPYDHEEADWLPIAQAVQEGL